MLLPVDISFEKVGDNWDIEDNKDADGKWMPGKGKRMFVDAKTPKETAMRDTVYVKVQNLPQGLKVQLKAFDVDDPTPDDLDPKHVIDPNDTNDIKRGNDNKGYDNLGIQQPPHFASTGDVSVTCTVDAQGVARLDNGEFPKLQMTDHPGDNVRVAAIFLKPDGTPFDGQNMNRLQVTDSTQDGYVPPGDEQVKGGFNGGVSIMLTVWRKLNIEIDSMEAVASNGNERNYGSGTVLKVTRGASGQSTVTGDVLLNSAENRFEHGRLTIGSTSYEVVSNSAYFTNIVSGDDIVVKGNVPDSAVGQSFTIVDDDDQYLAKVGLPPSLPRNQLHDDVVKGIRSKYAPAYIQVEDANALGWNVNQTIPFKLNESVDTPTGSVFNGAKDVFNTKAFWAYTITFGYQPFKIEYFCGDGDPDSEFANPGVLMGGGSKILLGYSSKGFAAIFVESIRDNPEAMGYLGPISTPGLNLSSYQKIIRDNYNKFLLGVIAHEIGHSPGSQTAGHDHNEGGLMRAGAGPITGADSNFVPETIARFRSCEDWNR